MKDLIGVIPRVNPCERSGCTVGLSPPGNGEVAFQREERDKEVHIRAAKVCG